MRYFILIIIVFSFVCSVAMVAGKAKATATVAVVK